MDVLITVVGFAAALFGGWLLWMDENEQMHHEQKRAGWLLLRRFRR